MNHCHRCKTTDNLIKAGKGKARDDGSIPQRWRCKGCSKFLNDRNRQSPAGVRYQKEIRPTLRKLYYQKNKKRILLSNARNIAKRFGYQLIKMK